MALVLFAVPFALSGAGVEPSSAQAGPNLRAPSVAPPPLRNPKADIAPRLAPRPAPRPGERGRTVASFDVRVDARAAASSAPAPAAGASALPMKPRSGPAGFVLRDVATGAVLESRLPRTPFIPASVTKVPTALYALHALGPEYRFETRMVGTGPVEHGTLRGDLYLIGGGDPTLDTADLVELAKALAAAGVRNIEGEFFYDASAFPTTRELRGGQPRHAAYNPSLSGLNLNFNRVLLKWRRIKKGTYDLEALAHAARWSTPSISVLASVAPPDAARAVFDYRTRGDGAEEWRINRKVLSRRGSRWFPVRDPGRYAATTFRAVAAENALALPQPKAKKFRPRRGAKELATHHSRPLDQILRGMLKHSTNLTAEAVGLASTYALGGRDLSFDTSSAWMSSWITSTYGLGEKTGVPAVFRNHSGLTPDSRVTPEDVTDLLIRLGRDAEAYEIMADLLPSHRVRKLTGAKVLAKTGTMYFGRALAGYIACDRGRRLAFSYMHSDIPARNRFDARFDPDSLRAPSGATAWLGRARQIERELLRLWTKRHC